MGKYNLENIRTLDDVETFLNKNLPNEWKVQRGKYYEFAPREHAEDYEVIQVILPTGKVYAEFWRGYYPTDPNYLNSLYGPRICSFACRGGLTFAIDAVMKKMEKLSV